MQEATGRKVILALDRSAIRTTCSLVSCWMEWWRGSVVGLPALDELGNQVGYWLTGGGGGSQNTGEYRQQTHQTSNHEAASEEEEHGADAPQSSMMFLPPPPPKAVEGQVSLLSREEVALGCFEPGCQQLFGWRTGTRICGRCQRHFCEKHCRWRRKLPFTVPHSPQGKEETRSTPSSRTSFLLSYVCARCCEELDYLQRGGGEGWFLGKTRDHTTEFLARRQSKHGKNRDRTRFILRRLAKLSQEKHEKQHSNATSSLLSTSFSSSSSSSSSHKSTNNSKKNSNLSSDDTEWVLVESGEEEYQYPTFQHYTNPSAASVVDMLNTTMSQVVVPWVQAATEAVAEWASMPATPVCVFCRYQFQSVMEAKYQCKLCRRVGCCNCCRFAVTLARCAINPKAPASVDGSVITCIECSQLIKNREASLAFHTKKKAAPQHPFKLLYDSVFSIKAEIDYQLRLYFGVRTSMDVLEGFEVLEEESGRKKSTGRHRQKTRDALEHQSNSKAIDPVDDVVVEWWDEEENEAEVHRSGSDRPDEGEIGDDDEEEEDVANDLSESYDELKKQYHTLQKKIVGMLVSYHKAVNEIMTYEKRFPNLSSRERLLIYHVKTALWEYKNDSFLPFSKTLPKPQSTKSERTSS
ncbi:carboxypeptidase Y-deficient [Balamuthia mandrillaris]